MDEGKDGTIKMARPHHTTRMYTSGTKGAKDGLHKSPETTKTADKDVKRNDTDTSKRTVGRECIQSKSTGPSNEPTGKESKPVMPVTPQKADVKQVAGKSQPDSPGDTSGQQKKYNGPLIGGLLLLIASAIAVS
jgi:hypothetical protein